MSALDDMPDFTGIDWNTPSVKQPASRFVVKIKRSSKYAYQAPKGGWFDIEFNPNDHYCIRGNHNRYTFADVAIGIRHGDGAVTKVKP